MASKMSCDYVYLFLLRLASRVPRTLRVVSFLPDFVLFLVSASHLSDGERDQSKQYHFITAW